MTLAAFLAYREEKKERPKYVISFTARTRYGVRECFIANGTNGPESSSVVFTEKEACYFQYSKEVVGIFASATAGNFCKIIIAKQCSTPANKMLIENESFQEEILISRQNKARCPTYFSGRHTWP